MSDGTEITVNYVLWDVNMRSRGSSSGFNFQVADDFSNDISYWIVLD